MWNAGSGYEYYISSSNVGTLQKLEGSKGEGRVKKGMHPKVVGRSLPTLVVGPETGYPVPHCPASTAPRASKVRREQKDLLYFSAIKEKAMYYYYFIYNTLILGLRSSKEYIGNII